MSVPDHYKNQEICNKADDNYPHTLEFVPECFTTQEMCHKVVSAHSSTIQFVSECYKTQKMCDNPFNKYFLGFFIFYFLAVPVRYKTQEMCDRFISDDHFSITYVPDQYKTQQMCDKAVDDCLAALQFVSDWFVTSKTIKILFTALYADENILYFNEDSGNVVFICNKMGILSIDLNNINLGDINYDEEDLDTIILIRLLAWHIKFEKCKTLKK